MSEEYKRVILVTGSNTGIGFDVVKLLAEKGHTVYLAARKVDAGKEAQQKLKNEYGLDVKFVQLDVQDIKSIEAARDTIDKEEGRLDVLVNNAGISGMGDPQTADAMDMNVLRSVFETNFFGLVQTTTTLLPLIRKAKRGYGNIVQTSMRWASGEHQSSPNGITTFAAYCSSKSAVNMYSIALARELKKDGIRVNCLCPGFVTTKLNHFRPGGKTTEQGANLFPEWCLLGPGTEDKTGLFWDADGQVPW
ncbi:short-chain dehydrogenase reductase sdr [Moniliophthora roreri MCA 2997]|uniref:Short-chain dehydrogenase reductase sdr n=2 Tax=Moniliophthora roreri TaxID=221103 RepID=V2XD67_MONRO|nr:short-chain dehydrogenase reductase sdr [Moniliophthora roreri MCA 2997]